MSSSWQIKTNPVDKSMGTETKRFISIFFIVASRLSKYIQMMAGCEISVSSKKDVLYTLREDIGDNSEYNKLHLNGKAIAFCF